MSAFMHFIPFLALFCIVSSAAAYDYRDFRIPPHRVFALSGTFSGARNSTRVTDSDLNRATGRMSGSGGLRSYWLTESDRYQLQLYNRAGFFGTYERTASSDHYALNSTDVFINAADRLNAYGEDINSQCNYRVYPWSFPIGVTGSANGDAEWSQRWSRERDELTESDTLERTKDWHVNDDVDYRVSGSLGFGVGRVRDVGGVYVAYVIEQRLREEGVLTAELSAATRQRLSELAFTRPDLKHRHQRPDRFYWQEVERILCSDPSVDCANLDAYALYRIDESPFESQYVMRRCGFFLGAELVGSHDRRISRQSQEHSEDRWVAGILQNQVTYSISNRNEHFSDALSAQIAAEYFRPISPEWQLDAEVNVRFPLREQEVGDWTDVWSHATLTWLLTDRWFVQTTARFQRYIYRDLQGQRNSDRWYTSGIVDVSYYLEDHVALNLETDWNFNRSYNRYNQRQVSEVTYMNTSVGLTYHFKGIALQPYDPGPPRSPRY